MRLLGGYGSMAAGGCSAWLVRCWPVRVEGGSRVVGAPAFADGRGQEL